MNLAAVSEAVETTDQRLDALRTAAEGSDNLMPYILDCARVYCTEGEICGELRKVFGEYRPMEVL